MSNSIVNNKPVANIQSVAALLKRLQEDEIKFVDFRFTDSKGKWQHTAFAASAVNEESFKGAIMFDGSSISGWKNINESDMMLIPDPDTAFLDPFSAHPTLIVNCDIVDPTTNQGYGRDPKHIAGLAEQYLRSTGIADTAYIGPELEFFVFDSMRHNISMNGNFYEIDAEEAPYNSGTKYDGGNMGHRPTVKGGYYPVMPVDSLADLRAEMMMILADVGLEAVLHHHEVAPSQCELGFKYASPVDTALNVQKYKYVIHNVAASFGKTATFMPKPIFGDNGSGMHVHQSLWKDGKPLFTGDLYAGLSETALYYIGGIIKHARSLNGFTNPATNSYKRLIPGYEAPVLLAYSERNRSASIRIPFVANEKAKRIEVRFPDPVANPYLAFAAMLMAGIDGIKHKIHPGEPNNQDLYHLPKDELGKIPTVCGSLREALAALNEDRAYLKEGGVFTDDQIDAYIALKMTEVERFEHVPHPVEFEMYYSC